MVKQNVLLVSVVALMMFGCQNGTVATPGKSSKIWQMVKTTGSDASECGRYTLALDRDGYLWGWGDKRDTLMGFFVSRPDTDTPGRITHHHDWTKVVMGCYSTFGLRSDGSLWGWGSNSGIASGQIMPGADAGQLIKPTEITGAQKQRILQKMRAVTAKLAAKEIDVL